ncbi:MAG: cytochrome c-type biogenesis protein CcmH [Chloroflexi bacterium]|nr:cytochrome c-type biogenesis protein CcmH [Chloroflexota bacterium]
MTKPIVVLAGLLLTVLALPSLVFAQDAPPDSMPTDDEVNAVAEQLYCPVCDNVPLDVCPTQACIDWREEIRVQLADGQGEDEIITWFADRYGQRVLATPEAQGIDLALYVGPPLAMLLGLGILLVALRRMAPATHNRGVGATHYDDLDPIYVSRLEHEVKEFRA